MPSTNLIFIVYSTVVNTPCTILYSIVVNNMLLIFMYTSFFYICFFFFYFSFHPFQVWERKLQESKAIEKEPEPIINKTVTQPLQPVQQIATSVGPSKS